MYHCRRFLPKLAKGMYMIKYQESSLGRGFLVTSLLHHLSKTTDTHYIKVDYVPRCSIASETHDGSFSQTDILSFVKSAFHKLEGPNHYWLNDIGGNTKSNQDGIFLVLVFSITKDTDIVGYNERVTMFHRVKLLQQRYPELNVLALCCGSIDLASNHAWITEAIMEEYVTFPILVLKKDFMKIMDHVGFLLCKGSTDHVVHFNLDIDHRLIVKAIEECSPFKKETALAMQNTDDKTRHMEIVKEPYFNSLRNLILCYPGSVSVDEDGNHIFISDSNHHRIIISDGAGKILDCIGCSPGFEDGEFESAKLFRPAGSFYHPDENCLFFVDSENHAIRRADMKKRVLETIYPACVRKSSSIWSWILDKLGLETKVVSQPGELDVDLIKFPWYLMKTRDNDLLTIDRSFETLWVVSMETGEIKRIVRGVSNIMEMCGDMIMEKVTLLKDIYQNMPSKRLHHCLSLEGIPFAGLFSSVASFQNDVILCDAASQRVLKYHRESRGISFLHFSNLGVLGLPYWMVCPLERVVNSGNAGSFSSEQLHHFDVLPGRCDIQFSVDIPHGTELVAPVDRSCIWCQARGSAAELSGLQGAVAGAKKVGVAQQWFDELDNLAFLKMEDEPCSEDGEELPEEHFQVKDKIHFDCSLTISPGTAEVVVSAVVYLKPKKTQGSTEEWSLPVTTLLDCNKHEVRKLEEDASIRLLSKTFEDVEDMIFMKPLHIRLRFECADHPAGETTKETICTDSTIKDAVLDGGIPFNRAYGMTAFEYHGTDPRFNAVFNDGMKNHSIIITKKLLDIYRGFDDVNRLVDVGGGIGATLFMITSKHPHIHAINFDLPHVISEAPPFPGVEHVGGDMFASVPSGDAILMKWILHDWSDEHCTKILKSCWEALPEKGKVIVVECVLPVVPEPTPRAQGVFHVDLIMLAHNPGGKERTEEEFHGLAKQAGFSGFKATYIFANAWVIEFTK